MRDPISRLMCETHRLLGAMTRSEFAPLLQAWPLPKERRAVAPSPLPVLRFLDAIRSQRQASQHAAVGSLVAALCDAALSLAWKQSYSAAEVGAPFMDHYGWSELIGACGPVASARFACGFLLLGPQTLYPRHCHEAREIYIPLAGRADWQQGDAVWRAHEPGSIIVHASEEPHAMQTGSEALAALYVWRSDRLDQKARLSP